MKLTHEPPIDDLRDRQIRLEYYGGKLFTGQSIRGRRRNYDDLKQVYQIAILAKDKFFTDQVFLHTFVYILYTKVTYQNTL